MRSSSSGTAIYFISKPPSPLFTLSILPSFLLPKSPSIFNPPPPPPPPLLSSLLSPPTTKEENKIAHQSVLLTLSLMMMTMNAKDDWVAAALSDDTLVADLLSRLNQSSSQPPKPLPSASLPLPLGWGHRQPRSKPKKDSAATRSPTTPLSWSGGGGAASPSDGDYSNSNSSRLSSDLSRSKVCILFLLCSVPNIVSVFPSFLPQQMGATPSTILAITLLSPI